MVFCACEEYWLHVFEAVQHLDCSNPSWIGDGYCDDDTNNEPCEYDGGDCCVSDIDTQYCTECQCIEHNTTAVNTTAPNDIGAGLSLGEFTSAACQVGI